MFLQKKIVRNNELFAQQINVKIQNLKSLNVYFPKMFLPAFLQLYPSKIPTAPYSLINR